jgi:hypothetical protein
MCGRIPIRVDRLAYWFGLAVVVTALAAAGCASNPVREPSSELQGPTDPFSYVLSQVGGGRVELSQYRGRVLMLDFFATWSQPSLVTISNHSVLQGKYSKKGLAVIGVALDELGDDVVAPFAAGMQIPYPVVLANKAIRSGRSVFGPLETLPTLLVFDRAGRLAKIYRGLVTANQVERTVLQLL